MTRRHSTFVALTVALVAMALLIIGINTPSIHAADDAPQKSKAESAKSPKHSPATTLTEARDRARLLHQTIHGLLQVVHRHYYREDEGLPLPSATFEEVFEQLEDNWDVKMRWISVNGKAMRVGHKPQNQFEKDAVKALVAGKDEFGKADRDRYQFVGAIRLSSQCLKCHVPNRKTLEDRIAGLVISMPIGKQRAK